MRAFVAAMLLSVVTSCALAPSGPPGTTWSRAFTPPAYLDTERFHLERLGPEHTDSDYVALMSCRERLRETLRWGEWPRADMTRERNREDLTRHAREFDERLAYAYTVQDAARTRCVGCVYLDPPKTEPKDRRAELQLWVIDAEHERGGEAVLLDAMLAWIERAWPIDEVWLRVRVENVALHDACRARIGEPEGPAHHGELLFIWKR